MEEPTFVGEGLNIIVKSLSSINLSQDFRIGRNEGTGFPKSFYIDLTLLQG